MCVFKKENSQSRSSHMLSTSFLTIVIRGVERRHDYMFAYCIFETNANRVLETLSLNVLKIVCISVTSH